MAGGRVTGVVVRRIWWEGGGVHLRDPERGQRLRSDSGVVGKIGDISLLVDLVLI